MDPKLKAAIVAAINTYMEEQEALAARGSATTRWGRQGRIEALRAAQVCFTHQRPWHRNAEGKS